MGRFVNLEFDQRFSEDRSQRVAKPLLKERGFFTWRKARGAAFEAGQFRICLAPFFKKFPRIQSKKMWRHGLARCEC